MEEFEEIDYRSIGRERKQLEQLTSDRYWNEFNGDWKRYLEDVFKYDDEPIGFKKPFRMEIKLKPHPFSEWITSEVE